MASAHELRPLLSPELDFRGSLGLSQKKTSTACGSSYGSVAKNGADVVCTNGSSNNGTGYNNSAGIASLSLPRNLLDTLSLISLYLCIIVSDACRGLLFPTLWFNVARLGGSASALGSIVALINVGKMIGAPVQGFLADCFGTKVVLILSNVVISLGAAMYAFASSYSSSNANCGGRDHSSFAIHLIMVSHCVLGIGAGNLGIIRSSIMDYSSDAGASTNMAYLSILQYGAYITLPVIGSLLTIWAPSMDNSEISASHAELLSIPNSNNNNCNLEAQQSGGNFYAINNYNISGLVLFLLATFNVFFAHKFLKLQDRSKYTTSATVDTTDALYKNAASLSENIADSSFIGNSPWPTAIILCCALNLVIKGSVGVFETFALSFAMTQFEWAAKTSGIVLAVCGVLGIMILSQFAVLAKYYNDSTIILAGMILMAVSFTFLIVDAQDVLSLSRGDPSEESKFSLQIRSIFLYASFMAMLGCGYPLAHTSLLGALSSNIKKTNVSISNYTCQADTATAAAYKSSDGTSINNALKIVPSSTGTSGSEGSNTIGNGIGSGATLNSWFVFFGFMGKLVLPLFAGFLLNSQSYGAVFSMIFCLLLASIIIAIKCRQLLS